MTDDNQTQETFGRRLGPQKIRRLFFLVLVPLAGLVLALIFYLQGGRYVETDNAHLKADVIPISPRVSGSIQTVAVRENQLVAAGDTLFELDAEPFEVAVERAEARLGQVRAELSALQTSYREKQASIELAKTNHAFAKRELQRQRDMKGKNFVSASTMDDLEHRVAVAERELDVLRLDLQRIAASLGGNAEAPLENHPRYLSARADLREAQYNLRHVVVRAPRAGTVSQVPNPGEFVREGQSTLALVGDGQVWVEANFPETDLTHVEAGQSVEVRIDTYPDRRWQGRVDSISPATGAEFAILPPQNATGNWVKIAQRVPVKIQLNVSDDAPTLRSGLSAVVEIDTEQRRRLLGQAR